MVHMPFDRRFAGPFAVTMFAPGGAFVVALAAFSGVLWAWLAALLFTILMVMTWGAAMRLVALSRAGLRRNPPNYGER